MKSKIDFPWKYSEIIERLHNIQPENYAGSRNFIDGSVSYLSPYIARGVISTKQVMQFVLEKDLKSYRVSKFLQELAWRDYFQRVHQSLGDKIMDDIKYPQQGAVHKQMPAAVYSAATGIRSLDNLIKQLYKTGYMHNHVRMYTASVTCNVGKVYWLQPSRWLYYHLMDGDIASNTCNWQWISGAFSWKKYFCNQANVNRYTHSKQKGTILDKPYAELVKMNIPEVLKKTIRISLQTKFPAFQNLNIDTGKPTLIYNSYNLDPLWRKDEDVNRVLLLEPSHFKNYPVSNKVADFVLRLSKNIKDISIYTGEVNDISKLYKTKKAINKNIISKEHPAFIHYPGIKDERDWMFPEVEGYYSSYSLYWKKAKTFLKKE